MLTDEFLGNYPTFRQKSGLSRRIFGLRSAGACENSDSDQNYYADANPHLRDANEVGRHGQSDDQNDESDQVGTE
jgi:hypothetical protein